jgi:hypothetical protein
MLNWISIVFQFAVQASDPSWSCQTVHRDPGLPGTYYLYCAQMSPEGIELITVGKFVPDTKVSKDDL